MYQKILVAYDGSEESRSALHECLRMAPARETEVHLLAVANVQPVVLAAEFGVASVVPADAEALAKNRMETVLERGKALLSAAGIVPITHVETGEPAQVIASLAERLAAQLVIVGHSSRKPFGLRWWRGTTDAVLLEKVRCSLLIAGDR